MKKRQHRTVEGVKNEKLRKARHRKTHPWTRFVEFARRRVRCTDERAWYPYYGAKGITCHLTAKQLEEIWKRDNAHTLKRASLDRLNSMYDYANWNVRFIEFEHNSRLAWDKNFVPPDVDAEAVFT